nr:hypothetical protein GCM10020092_061910 [Actinoplanes digitatis]
MALLLSVLAIVAPPAQGRAAAAVTFTNPVAAAPYGADPWMGYYNGNYYLAATTWNSQLVIKKAASVAALGGASETVVHTGSGSTNCCNMWAPSLHLLDGPNGKRWYYYYSAYRLPAATGSARTCWRAAAPTRWAPTTSPRSSRCRRATAGPSTAASRPSTARTTTCTRPGSATCRACSSPR